MQQTYTQSVGFCEHGTTGLMILMFGVDDRGRNQTLATLEKELGLSSSRLLPGIGGMIAGLNSTSFDLVLTKHNVTSVESDCIVLLEPDELAVEETGVVNGGVTAASWQLGVQRAPPSWGLDRIDQPGLPRSTARTTTASSLWRRRPRVRARHRRAHHAQRVRLED